MSCQGHTLCHQQHSYPVMEMSPEQRIVQCAGLLAFKNEKIGVSGLNCDVINPQSQYSEHHSSETQAFSMQVGMKSLHPVLVDHALNPDQLFIATQSVHLV